MFMISEKFVHLFHVKLSHIHCHFSKTNRIMFVGIVGAGSFVHNLFHWWCWISSKQVELFTSFVPTLVFVSLNTVFSLDQLTYLIFLILTGLVVSRGVRNMFPGHQAEVNSSHLKMEMSFYGPGMELSKIFLLPRGSLSDLLRTPSFIYRRETQDVESLSGRAGAILKIMGGAFRINKVLVECQYYIGNLNRNIEFFESQNSSWDLIY